MVGKPDIHELDIDVFWQDWELGIACDVVHDLRAHLAKVVSITAVGVSYHLLIFVLYRAAVLVDKQVLVRQEVHELSAYVEVLAPPLPV